MPGARLTLCFLQVSPTGAAGRDGRLRVGLRLLEVNQQSLLGLTHAEAVQLLRSVGDTLTVLVCDGFDTSTSAALEVSCLPWGLGAALAHSSLLQSGKCLAAVSRLRVGMNGGTLFCRPFFEPLSLYCLEAMVWAGRHVEMCVLPMRSGPEGRTVLGLWGGRT